MTPERWQQVKKILGDALELEVSRRSTYVAEVCAGDEQLRREVESLLLRAWSADDVERMVVDRPPSIQDQALRPIGATQKGPVDEISLLDVTPYTSLRVSTRRTQYDVIVVAPFAGELLVRGGLRFPQATPARVRPQNPITVGKRLRLKLGARKVVTSKIMAIDVLG